MKIISILLAIALLASQTAFASNRMKVYVNQEFTISLESNPTTGYWWQADFDENTIELVTQWYEQEPRPGLGVGGTEFFTFKALQKGKTKITMVYKRPWLEEIRRTEIYFIHIKKLKS